MKKITFEVTQKNISMNALLKEVNKISCRLQLDIKNGFVTAEDVDDTMIDTVIELIENYFTVVDISLDNIVESDDILSTVESVIEESEQVETVLEPEAVVKTVNPQSEKDLIIERVKFENAYIAGLMNKFLRTAYWAMYKKKISEREIGRFIYTSMAEISMRYNEKKSIAFSIGDVVDCNYGTHLEGEVEGGHTSAIVCNIFGDGLVYVVPITKTKENLKSHSYLPFTIPNDIIYDKRNYVGGTVLLDKGKYVREVRFNEVIGKTNPEFFAKILNQLASSTFDFTEIIADTTVANGKEAEISEKPLTNKKTSGAEKAFLEAVGFAFDKLDPSKKIEEQLDSFLTDIGMTSEEMVKQSFVIACNIKKITYENVILELHKIYPKIVEENIKAILKENFKKWLEQSKLAEKCPRMSFMSVLKMFAKRFI